MLGLISGVIAGVGGGPLLAARVVNEQAVALSPTIGWLLLACATVFFLLWILQADRWRRLWLRTEDPRTIGLFRILFALFVILNIDGLWQHWEFLFTDEGIFFTDTARQNLASKQFAGFGNWMEGEAGGFTSWAAFLEFLKGPKYSLLFFWDSPTAFYIHLIGFHVVAILFMIGWRARLMGVLTWFLMISIMDRNPLFMEGTDVVYFCFFFYLILARTGHAYSVDNWLRCRRLRAQGRLSEPGGPGGGAGAPPSEQHPRGLEAVYRRIPSWPRLLMMLQLCTIYMFTGCAKTGSVWWRGDTLYYALNMDHFYRVPPQYLSSIMGTNMFRLMTWVVHVWQICFPLVVIGLIIRWAARERFQPLSPARRWTVRGLWIALGLLALAVAEVAWPVHYNARFGVALQTVQWLFGVVWILAMALVGWGYYRLRHRPFTLRLRGREYTLDIEWFGSWFLGRRLWLTIGIFFHGHLLVLMNIGMFAPIMLLTYMVFLSGIEWAGILRAIGRGLSRFKSLARVLPGDLEAPPLPCEDPTLPRLHRDAARVPEWALLAALGLAVAAIVFKVEAVATGYRWMIWTGAGAVLVVSAAISGYRYGRTDMREDGRDGGLPDRPWAYGPIGRFFVASLVIYHVTAVACWILPVKDCLSTFRTKTHEPFRTWLRTTHTAQGWNMFAPNPPRSNVFLKVLVTDQNGETYDLKTDVYAPEMKPMPWILNDRIRKMNRRMSSRRNDRESWYLKWHGRYHCRRWAMDHEGVAPEKIELVKVWYKIPSPEQVRKLGYYIPEIQLEKFGHSSTIRTTRCATDPEAQIPNYQRERHGLPLLEEDEIKLWKKQRLRKWERKLEREAKKAAREAAGEGEKGKAKLKPRNTGAEARHATRVGRAAQGGA